MVRVHRIPFSTNVERIALAAGIKGVTVEWVDHDPGDRSALLALSGQELVPVAEFDGEVVCDSMRILRHLEFEHLQPPLWPVREDARVRVDIFLAWFNEVWKRAPNALDNDPGGPEAPHHAEILKDSARDFDRLLGGAPYLAGTRAGVEDVCAYPFLRYAVHAPAAGDDEPFHGILHRHLSTARYPNLAVWVERIAALPQA